LCVCACVCVFGIQRLIAPAVASVSLYATTTSMPEVRAKEAASVDLKQVRESIVKLMEDDAETR